MKKWFIFAASMIAAVSVLSCTKIFPGDDDPKVPVTGDEDGNLVFNCPEAYGYFNGQYSDENGNLIDYDYYTVEFDTEGISFDESNGFTGTGYVAFIAIDTEHTASIAIPEGIYSSDVDPDSGFYAYPGGFGTGDDGTGYVYPAYIIKIVNFESEIILAEKVKLTVSSSASNYMLKAELTDAAGNVYVFNYNGALEIWGYSASDVYAAQAKSSLSKKALVKKLQNRKNAAASHPTK